MSFRIVRIDNDINTSQFKDIFETYNSIEDSIEKTNRLFELLYDLTVFQDKVQLSIPKINDGVKWALNMINSANAFILELSKIKGDNNLGSHNWVYIEKHIENLRRAYNRIRENQSYIDSTISSRNIKQMEVKYDSLNLQTFSKSQSALKDELEKRKNDIFKDQEKLMWGSKSRKTKIYK